MDFTSIIGTPRYGRLWTTFSIFSIIFYGKAGCLPEVSLHNFYGISESRYGIFSIKNVRAGWFQNNSSSKEGGLPYLTSILHNDGFLKESFWQGPKPEAARGEFWGFVEEVVPSSTKGSANPRAVCTSALRHLWICC